MPLLIHPRQNVLFMHAAGGKLVLVKPAGRDEPKNRNLHELLQLSGIRALRLRTAELLPAYTPHFANIIQGPEITCLLATHGEMVIGEKVQFAYFSFNVIKVGLGPLSVCQPFPDALQTDLERPDPNEVGDEYRFAADRIEQAKQELNVFEGGFFVTRFQGGVGMNG